MQKQKSENQAPQKKPTKCKALRVAIFTGLLLTAGAAATFTGFFINSNPEIGILPPNTASAKEASSEEETPTHDTVVCKYNDSGALLCAPSGTAGSTSSVPSGYILCSKNANNKIVCSDGNGSIIDANCITTADGHISCTDKDGDKINNVLTCTLSGPNTLACIREDGTLIEILLNNEVIVEVAVEKEVIKEVEKEVIKEVEKRVIVEKTSPILTNYAQTPTAPTNGNVTITLVFNKEIKLPDGWAYGNNKTQIVRTYTNNINTSLTVSDLSGNSGSASIVITNIDKTAPSCSWRILTGGGTTWVYAITCNEPARVNGWSKVNDYEYTFTFPAFQSSLDVEVLDTVGNKSIVKLGS
jgi:hypothetical protein